ncbi:uncharacterized protein LOC106665161 isoform X2 [Cimex lectularius]|nr:uncharacterized protein LOC106665161 isoform X2 [Cimex lectularius]
MSDEETGGPSRYETNYSIPSVNSEWNNVVELFHELKSLLDNCNREAQHSWAIIDKVKRSASIITLELEDLGKEISDIGICNKSSETSTYIGIEPYSDHLLGSLQCRKNCGKLSSGRAITSSDSDPSANNENNNVENRDKDNVNEPSEKFECNNSCYLIETNACENSTDGQASYDSEGSHFTSARYNGISNRFSSRKNWRLSSLAESDEGISIVSKEKEEILKNIKKPKNDVINVKLNCKNNKIKSYDESKPDSENSSDSVPIKAQQVKPNIKAEILHNTDKLQSSEGSTIEDGSDFTVQSDEKNIASQNCSQTTTTEEQSVINTSRCNNNDKPQLLNSISNLTEEDVKDEVSQESKSVVSNDAELKESKIADPDICAQAKKEKSTSEQEDNLKPPVNYFPESDDYIETILSPNCEKAMFGQKKPIKKYFETENEYLKPNKNIIVNPSYNDEKEQYNIQFCVPFTDRVCYSALTKTNCTNVNPYYKDDTQLSGQTQKLPPIPQRRIPVKYCEFSNVKSIEGKKTVVGCVKSQKNSLRPIYKVKNMPSEVKFIATVYPTSVSMENNTSTTVTRHNMQRGYVSTFRVNPEKKPRMTPYGTTIYSHQTLANKPNFKLVTPKYHHRSAPFQKHQLVNINQQKCIEYPQNYNESCSPRRNSQKQSNEIETMPVLNRRYSSVKSRTSPSAKIHSINDDQYICEDDQQVFARINPNGMCEVDNQKMMAGRVTQVDECDKYDQQVIAGRLPQADFCEDEQVKTAKVSQDNNCKEDEQMIRERTSQSVIYEDVQQGPSTAERSFQGKYRFTSQEMKRESVVQKERSFSPPEIKRRKLSSNKSEKQYSANENCDPPYPHESKKTFQPSDEQMITERTSQSVIYENVQQGTSTVDRSFQGKYRYLETDCEIIPYEGNKFTLQEMRRESVVQKERSFSPPEIKLRRLPLNKSENNQYSANENNCDPPYLHESKKNSCDSSVREAFDNTSEQRVTVPSDVTLFQDIKSIAEDWNGESENYMPRKQSSRQRIENIDNDSVIRTTNNKSCGINTSELERPTEALCDCKRYGCDKYCNLKKRDNSSSIATESQLGKVASKPHSETTENNPTICNVSTEQNQLQIRKQNNFFRVQKMVNFAQQKFLTSKNLEESTCKINFLSFPNKMAKDKRSIYKLSSTSTTELSDSELTDMPVQPYDTTHASVCDKQSQCNSVIAEKSQVLFKLSSLDASYPLKQNKTAGTLCQTEILSDRKSDSNPINSPPKIEEDLCLYGNSKRSTLKLKSHFMCQTENRPILEQNEKNKGMVVNPVVESPTVNFEISSNDKLLITTFTQYEADTGKPDNPANQMETVPCKKTKEVKTISTETSTVYQYTKLSKPPAVEKVDKCENTMLKFNIKSPKLTNSLTIYDKRIKKDHLKSQEHHTSKINSEVKSNNNPIVSNVSIKHQETNTDKTFGCNELNKVCTNKENSEKVGRACTYVNTSTSMEDDLLERYTSYGKPKYLSNSNVFLIKNLSKRCRPKESLLNQRMRKSTMYRLKDSIASKCKHKRKHKHKQKRRRKSKCTSLNTIELLCTDNNVNDINNDCNLENINRFMTNSVCCPINIGNSNGGNLPHFTNQELPSDCVNTENKFNIPHSFKNYVSTYINQNILPMLLSNNLINLDQINQKVVQDARETLMNKLFPEDCEDKKNVNLHDTTDNQSLNNNGTSLNPDIDSNKQNKSQSNSLPSETSDIVHNTDSKATVNFVVMKDTKEGYAADLVSSTSFSLKKNVKQSKSATSMSVSSKHSSDIIKVTSHQNLKSASGLQSENESKHGRIEKKNVKPSSHDSITPKPNAKLINYNKLKKIIAEYSSRNVCKGDSTKKFPSDHARERKHSVTPGHIKLGETDSITKKYGFQRSESNNSRKVNTIGKNLSKQKSTSIENTFNKFHSSKSQFSYRKPIKELPAELSMYKPQNDAKLNKSSMTQHFNKSSLNNYKEKTLQANKSGKICGNNGKTVNQKQDSTKQKSKNYCNPHLKDYNSLSFRDYISKQQTICEAEVANMLKIMSKRNGKVLNKHDLKGNSRFWISNCHVKLLKSIKKLYSNDFNSDHSTAELKKKLFSKDAKEILRKIGKGKTDRSDQTEACSKQKGGNRYSQTSKENDFTLLAMNKRGKYNSFLKPNIHTKKLLKENCIQNYENKNTNPYEDTDQLKRTDSIKKLKMCIEQIENKLPHFIIEKKHKVSENKIQRKRDKTLQTHSVSLNTTKIQTVCTCIQNYEMHESDIPNNKTKLEANPLSKRENIVESSTEDKVGIIQTDNLNHDESFNFFEDSINAKKVTSDNKIIKCNKSDIKGNTYMLKTAEVQTQVGEIAVHQITTIENYDVDQKMKPILIEELEMLDQSNISTSRQRIRPPLTAQDFELSEKMPLTKSFSWINNLRGFDSKEKLTSKKLSEVLCNVESKTIEEELNQQIEKTNLATRSESPAKAKLITRQRSKTTCNINESSLKFNKEESKLMRDERERLEIKESNEKQQSRQSSSIENQLAFLRQRREDYIEKINSALKNCEENAKVTYDFNEKFQGRQSDCIKSTYKTSFDTILLNESKDSVTPIIPEQKLTLLTLPHLETQEETSSFMETSQKTDKKETSNTSVNSIKDMGSSTKINREKPSSENIKIVEIREVDDSNYHLAKDSFSVNILAEIVQEQSDKALNEADQSDKHVENKNNDEQNSENVEYRTSQNETINYSQILISGEQSRENIQKPLLNEENNIWQNQKNIIEQIKNLSSKHSQNLVSQNELKEECIQNQGSKDENIKTSQDMINQSVVGSSQLNMHEQNSNKNLISDNEQNEENMQKQTNNETNMHNQECKVEDQNKTIENQTCEHTQSRKYTENEINKTDQSSKVGFLSPNTQKNETEVAKQIDQTNCRDSKHDLQTADNKNQNVSQKVETSQANVSDNSNRTNFLSFQEFQREISEMKKRVQRTMSQDRENKPLTCKSDDHENPLPSGKTIENDVPESLDSIQFWKQSQNKNFANNKVKKPLTSSSNDDLNTTKAKNCDKVITEDTKSKETDHQPVIMTPSEFKSRTERKKLSNTYKSCRKDEIINSDPMTSQGVKKTESSLQTSNFTFPLVSQLPFEHEKQDSEEERKNTDKINSVNSQPLIEIRRINSKNILTELDMYHNSIAKWQMTPSIEEIMKNSKGTGSTSRKRVDKSALKERTKEGKIIKRKTNKLKSDGQKQIVSKLNAQQKEKVHEKARKGFTMPIDSRKDCNSLPIKCDSYKVLIVTNAKHKEPGTSIVHETRVKGKHKVEVAQKGTVKPHSKLTKHEDRKLLSPSPARAKSTDRSTPKGDCSRGLSQQTPPKLMPFELYKINQFLTLDNNKKNLSKTSVDSYLKLLRQLSTTIEDLITLMKLAFKKENVKLINKFYSRSKNQYIKEKSKQLYKHLVTADTKKITKQKMCGDYDAATSTSSPKTMSLPAKNESQKISDSALRVTKTTLEYVYKELTMLKTQINQTMFVEVRNQIASNKSLSKSENEKMVQAIDLELNKIKSLGNQIDMLSRDLKQRIEMEGDLDEFHTRLEKSYVSKFEHECTKLSQDEAMKKLKHEAIIETKTQLNDKLNEINNLIQHQIQEQSRQEKARSTSEVSLRKKLEHIGEVLQTELNNIQAVLAGNQVDLKENNEKIKEDSKNKYVHRKRNMFEKTCSLDERIEKGPFKPLETSPKHGIGGNVVKAKQSLEEKMNEDLKEKYLKKK